MHLFLAAEVRRINAHIISSFPVSIPHVLRLLKDMRDVQSSLLNHFGYQIN